MKLLCLRGSMGSNLSRPARGAWIETGIYGVMGLFSASRAPHGARGLKLDYTILIYRIPAWRPAPGAVEV